MEGIEDNELTCLDRRKSRCWGHYCSGGRIRSLDSQTTKKERGRGGDGEIAVVCLPLSLPLKLGSHSRSSHQHAGTQRGV